MPATAAQLSARLSERLPGARVEVLDESAAHAGHAGANAEGWGSHFRVRVASNAFHSLSRVARHRLVYEALAEFIARDGVHALAIEASDGAAA